MNNRISLFIFCIIFCFFIIPSKESLASFEMAPVEILTTSTDIVGIKLVNKLKEDIRRSSSVKISYDKNEPRLKVSIVTLDPALYRFIGNYTIYSMVISFCAGSIDTFITNYVGITSNEKVNDASERIIMIINDKKHDYEYYKKMPDYGQLMEMYLNVNKNFAEVQKQLEEEKFKSWWQKIWEK